MRDYRKLRVWESAHALAIKVRRATEKFPPSGYASLKAQIIEAAESVVSNIVEGAGARTQREFARFLDISIKSATELQGELELARDNHILDRRTWEDLDGDVVSTRRQTIALRKAIIRRDRDGGGSK
jgi:four helix bundle protein